MFKILKYFLLALPALLGALILTLAKTMPFMAENVFAASFFPVVSGALTWFSGLFPFSLTEFGLYALVLILLGGFSETDWVYVATVDSPDLADGEYSVDVITKRVRPISFVLN